MKEIVDINNLISELDGTNKRNQISDGYHTFGELYDHRVVPYLVLTGLLQEKGFYVWRSKLHDDGTFLEGMFVLGVNAEQGKQISYHLEVDTYWNDTNFAETLERAPKYDGHNSDDVLERLMGVHRAKLTKR